MPQKKNKPKRKSEVEGMNNNYKSFNFFVVNCGISSNFKFSKLEHLRFSPSSHHRQRFPLQNELNIRKEAHENYSLPQLAMAFDVYFYWFSDKSSCGNSNRSENLFLFDKVHVNFPVGPMRIYDQTWKFHRRVFTSLRKKKNIFLPNIDFPRLFLILSSRWTCRECSMRKAHSFR